ncbi:MAG: hypothetical protein ACKOA1_03660 [Bacteroidota bacterium]
MKTVLLLTVIIGLMGFYNTISGRKLDLGKADWTIYSRYFHLTGVTDGRSTKSPLGKITGAKPGEFTIDPDLATALSEHLDGCITADTSTTAGLMLLVDRFKISDAVSGLRHSVSMEFHLKLVRLIDGQVISVYESTLKPSFTGTGTDAPAGFYEDPIRNSLKSFFEGFDKWIQKGYEAPHFMNHVVVFFEDEKKWDNRTEGDTILWSEDYKLKWSDFLGKDDKNSPYSAQSNCVYTLMTTPEYRTDTFLIRESIQPVLTRGASWVKKDALQDTLLMHEQLHFDICELYARKFRSDLARTQLGLLSFDRQINELFRKAVTEYGVRQSLYDRETEHGTISAEQIRWMTMIRQELEELSEFRTGNTQTIRR